MTLNQEDNILFTSVLTLEPTPGLHSESETQKTFFWLHKKSIPLGKHGGMLI